MPRLKLTVAYTGTRYCGWQIQAYKKNNGPSTIQGELEKAVQRILGVPVRIHGAGRTDSGVHADAQIAHMDTPETTRKIQWQRSFRALLPQDIAVVSIEEVSDDFHARQSAIEKQYTYALWHTRAFVPPRIADYVWDCGEVNPHCMEEAARYLIGTHDYASFQNVGTDVKNGTIRTVRIIQQQELGSLHTVWHFYADGFLKQMVRNIMGLLVFAGKGKLDPQRIPEILHTRNRTALPSPTAPAKGLTLTKVFYG